MQRQQDRERAKSIAKLRQGDLISAGPQICVVDYSLATAYDFLQIPYLSGKVASAINGDWDSAWYLWAEVAESQLGKECDKAVSLHFPNKLFGKFVAIRYLTGTVSCPTSSAPAAPHLRRLRQDQSKSKGKRLDQKQGHSQRPDPSKSQRQDQSQGRIRIHLHTKIRIETHIQI